MERVLLQVAHPSFLSWTLPAIEGQQVRMAHTRPAYENVSLHGDVFSQVSSCCHSIPRTKDTTLADIGLHAYGKAHKGYNTCLH